MFVVYFLENKNILLSQLRKSVPSVGEELKIKGRKGKVSSVTSIDDRNIHVQVVLETVNKNTLIVDNSKKKKR
ncbi:hypothetical protein RCG23_24550 [Neobacillus sp. PS3-34]|uniref:hypothetical protein n=1 Tax=Neobacillus sp. PS3-34 TaxID=3070678 RepID=UPI0027E15C4E|nr:hypothetical protein [Neobacillus sp. PS3-34]WML48371.1 hypothetical protein RCG23_24550 [Neobacillus sp. PS3-34]